MADPFLGRYNKLCDSYRTALMNCICYDRRIERLKKLAYGSDIVISATSCSAIAAWNIFKIPGGASIWSFVLGAGAVFSILKTTLIANPFVVF